MKSLQRVVRLMPRLAKTGSPVSLGLFYRGVELTAEWYERQPAAASACWQVRVAVAFSGGVWRVDSVVMLDGNGKIVDQYPIGETVLCGPQRLTSLSPAAADYRRRHDMPMEDDPHCGDSLCFTINP